ncbi:MAG: hypothetical protein NW224_24135 [Leptolyngbyaceae cyanobacterium bins.302]|nr:hypothetical protein [Leptolyngbyaceae cyanobacterium bins.302]
MIKSTIFSTLAISLLSVSPLTLEFVFAPVALSQPSTRYSTADLVKARNLARQTIESLNGGLSRYRAENSMHGPITKAPFTENEDGTITFKFLGGTPAWKTPTVESVVTVQPSNWSIKVDYNGAVRR